MLTSSPVRQAAIGWAFVGSCGRRRGHGLKILARRFIGDQFACKGKADLALSNSCAVENSVFGGSFDEFDISITEHRCTACAPRLTRSSNICCLGLGIWRGSDADFGR